MRLAASSNHHVPYVNRTGQRKGTVMQHFRPNVNDTLSSNTKLREGARGFLATNHVKGGETPTCQGHVDVARGMSFLFCFCLWRVLCSVCLFFFWFGVGVGRFGCTLSRCVFSLCCVLLFFFLTFLRFFFLLSSFFFFFFLCLPLFFGRRRTNQPPTHNTTNKICCRFWSCSLGQS